MASDLSNSFQPKRNTLPELDGLVFWLRVVPGLGLGQLAEELYIAQLEGVLKTPAQAEKWATQWLKKHSTHH